ncbi:curlin repeat-containing protein [Vibrio mediterranei]|uniref:curlin repeat-containing protein n=1 Tax=Vibrio mediterranei TaxID=689 RepID=UPI002283304F|nr:curlin repeat-containing protein [Vibrio mediterranei]MCY9853439.1 curlin repeat-containing protein [Vibrio mediterranei]
MKMEQWLTVLFKTPGLFKCSALFSWIVVSLFLSESVVIAGEVNTSKVIVHTVPFESGEFLTGVTDATLSKYGFEEANNLDLSTESDLDNYSDINIANATSAQVVILQKSYGSDGKNKAKVSVSGAGNRVLAAQLGGRNEAYIAQEGDNNTAIVGQVGWDLSSESVAVVIQEGDDNEAYIGQKRYRSASSNVSVNQIGNGNIAAVVAGSGADLGISQVGNGSELIINASGSMGIYVNQTN